MVGRLALAVLVALGLSAPAWAHPHVLVDVHALVEFKDGKVVSLFMGWKFDPVYSASLLTDFDKNHNGKLDPAEIKAIEAEAFRDTAAQDYFTYASVAGKPVKWKDATDFSVMAVKDSLLYAFRLHLPAPVDPRTETFSFTAYEETFYIDLDFADDKAATVTGTTGCRAAIAPDPASAILGGLVTPKRVRITCD